MLLERKQIDRQGCYLDKSDVLFGRKWMSLFRESKRLHLFAEINSHKFVVKVTN